MSVERMVDDTVEVTDEETEEVTVVDMVVVTDVEADEVTVEVTVDFMQRANFPTC